MPFKRQKPVAPAKGALAKLQGSWTIVALEVDGQSIPTEAAQVTVKGDRFTTEGLGDAYAGKLLVGGARSPWTIDMKFTSGPEKGNTNKGIFEFSEAASDRWRLCLQMTSKSRPTKFATRAGSGLALETLERARPAAKRAVPTKKASSPAAQNFPTEPIPELEGEWAMIACSQNGEPLKAELLKMGKRVASGNVVEIRMGAAVILRALYAIDRTVQPHRIDYLLTHGPAKAQLQLGIFELQGGSLKVSFSAPGHPRPDDFSSTRGDGRTMSTWELVRK